MLQDKSHVKTIDHEDIKTWADTRQARPVRLRRFDNETITERVRFRFPKDEYPDEEDLTWEEFFDIFDRSRLEFVFEDIADEAMENRNLYQFRPRNY